MGDLRSGSGATPDDGGAHGLPDFPADWGHVVIPDDAAELDADVSALQRERRRQARQDQLRRLLGRPPRRPGEKAAPSILMPLSIMAVAVLVTLVSLFVVTWGRGPDNVVGLPTGHTGTAPSAAAASTELADVGLADTVGAPARLRAYLPAILLLVDGCDCGQLVADLAATAPAGVTVVALARTAPALRATPPNVRPLADPNGVVTTRFASSAVAGKATAVLLDKPGSVVTTVSGVDAANDLSSDQLARLAAR